MYKIGLLGDIHGNNFLLKRLFDLLDKELVDEYIVSGDIVTDGFENNEIISNVRERCKYVIAGNREVSLVNYDGVSWNNNPMMRSMLYTFNGLSSESMAFLKSLPIFDVFEIGNKKICVSHGSPYNVRNAVCASSEDIFERLLKDYPADIYVFAHTHESFHLMYKEKLFINAGAVSLSITQIPSSFYGILTIDDDLVNYEQRSYMYDFDGIKNYYVDSRFHKECFEWSNLLLAILKYGKSYHLDFIKFLTDSYNIEQMTDSLFNRKFYEYMNMNNLEIYNNVKNF